MESDMYICMYIWNMYIWNLKNDTNELIYKTEISSNIENKLMVTTVERGVINYEFGINRYSPLFIKQINNKDLLYSTGNCIQYLVIMYNERTLKKNTYVYI